MHKASRYQTGGIVTMIIWYQWLHMLSTLHSMSTSSEPQDHIITQLPSLCMLEWSLSGHYMFELITPLGTSKVN